MSKSKGNVADPLAVMDTYGTDAFRFTLAALAAQGRDIRMSEERVEGYRNFANKIWNASRLVLGNLDGYDPALARRGKPSMADRWIKSRLAATTAAVRKALDGYRFNDAASAVYQFLWHEFCDWYLEIAKRSLYQSEDPVARAVTQRTLIESLEVTLRLLHPFMPFLSEEIWQRLPHQGESIMVAPFPRAADARRNALAERRMQPVIDIVSAIRTIRSESRIAPGGGAAGHGQAGRVGRGGPRGGGPAHRGARARGDRRRSRGRAAAAIGARGGRRRRGVRAPRRRGRSLGRARRAS